MHVDLVGLCVDPWLLKVVNMQSPMYLSNI